MPDHLMIKRYGTVEYLCPGGEHDDIPCPGGEWRPLMSLGWFADFPAEALAIFREDPENAGGQYRMVIHTREVLNI